MTYCKLLLCFALLLNFYFFAFSLNVFLSFNWLMMFHKWAMLSAWVCYLTQLRVFSDALWICCTVCIEYSPLYLNYLKPWTCVYLRYTSGTALRDTRTVGRYNTLSLSAFVLASLPSIHSSNNHGAQDTATPCGMTQITTIIRKLTRPQTNARENTKPGGSHTKQKPHQQYLAACTAAETTIKA